MVTGRKMVAASIFKKIDGYFFVILDMFKADPFETTTAQE